MTIAFLFIDFMFCDLSAQRRNG